MKSLAWIFVSTSDVFAVNAMFMHGKEAQRERPATSGSRKTRRTRVKMQMGKETLLPFSYLFVPLLVLGMEGEKEREQVIGVLTLKANI